MLNRAKPKERKDKLFLLNASREFTKGDPKNYIPDDAIRRIADTFSAWQEVEKYSRIVSREEIAKNDFNISPSRYIHTGEADEYRPIAEIVEELNALEDEARETDAALMKIILEKLGVERMKQRIFISSVQMEFAEERQALKAYLLGDALLSRFFDVFLFEDIPARDRRADAVYIEEVRHCDLYLALLGDQYGWEDADGLSPTHREFNEATTLGKPRLVFVKGADDSGAHPKMRALIATAGTQLIRRRFTSSAELIPAVYASLVDYLAAKELLRVRTLRCRRLSGCHDGGSLRRQESGVSWASPDAPVASPRGRHRPRSRAGASEPARTRDGPPMPPSSFSAPRRSAS